MFFTVKILTFAFSREHDFLIACSTLFKDWFGHLFFYHTNEKNFFFKFTIQIVMNQLSNHHYLYLHSSIATQAQVHAYIASLIESFEKVLQVKLDKEFIVNSVFKFDGTPLKHSYVWFKSVQTADLFLNKDLQGKDRIDEFPDPDHDTSKEERLFQEFLAAPTPIGAKWVDLVEEEEKLYKKTLKIMIQRPKTRLVSLPGIVPSIEQKTKDPSLEKIDVEFYPCKIFGRSNVSYNKLFAIHVAKDVTESQIRKHFEPFAITKSTTSCGKHTKEYPHVYIDRKSNPNSVTVSYHPGSMDGIFALCMVKRVAVNEKCTLNFDLYREN